MINFDKFEWKDSGKFDFDIIFHQFVTSCEANKINYNSFKERVSERKATGQPRVYEYKTRQVPLQHKTKKQSLD